MGPHTGLRHTKKVSLNKGKKDFTEKLTPFLNKMNNMKKNVKVVCCDIAGENKTLE